YPVQVLWQREDETSQVVVVGPYPLFVSSFKTLRATKWLVDEESVRQICAVVAKALFDGQIQKLGKFAKEYLESRSINNVKTSPEAILDARLQIACTLLEYKGTEHREVEQAEQKTMLDGRRQTRRQPEEDASDFLIVDELEWTFI
ncbi:hypothetical protein AB205_0171730, partial [Aquarana catesbeiana]